MTDDEVKAGIDRSRARSAGSARGTERRRCYLCHCNLPLDKFRTITTTALRPYGTYKYVQLSNDCRACNQAYKRAQRRKRAEREGRTFVANGPGNVAKKARGEMHRAAKLLLRQEVLKNNLAERKRRADSSVLACRCCGVIKARSDFYASTGAARICRACHAVRDSLRFSRDRDLLTSVYIKRQLAKKSGLRHYQIPFPLIEAERARLLVHRISAKRKNR